MSDRAWENSVDPREYRRVLTETTIVPDGIFDRRPTGHLDPQAKGKKFWRLYLRIPFVTLISVIIQVIKFFNKIK